MGTPGSRQPAAGAPRKVGRPHDGRHGRAPPEGEKLSKKSGKNFISRLFTHF